MKQDDIITKDGNKFINFQEKCWKKCSTWRRSAMWPLSVQTMREKSTQGGSSVCEYPIRKNFQTVDNNKYYEFIHMKGIVVFKLRWKKETVKISWRLGIVKLNHVVEQIKASVVIAIKASLRMVLVAWLANLMWTVWLLWGENPLRTKNVTKNTVLYLYTITIKLAVLNECYACFCIKKLH